MLFARLFPQCERIQCRFASSFSFMYTVRGYSHPDLTPKVAKPTTNPSSDHDHHYYPPTPPSSTSPKLTTTTKPPSTPPPVVAPSPSLIHLIKTSITKTKTNSKLEWHPLPKFAGIDHSEQRINTTGKFLSHAHVPFIC